MPIEAHINSITFALSDGTERRGAFICMLVRQGCRRTSVLILSRLRPVHAHLASQEVVRWLYAGSKRSLSYLWHVRQWPLIEAELADSSRYLSAPQCVSNIVLIQPLRILSLPLYIEIRSLFFDQQENVGTADTIPLLGLVQ